MTSIATKTNAKWNATNWYETSKTTFHELVSIDGIHVNASPTIPPPPSIPTLPTRRLVMLLRCISESVPSLTSSSIWSRTTSTLSGFVPTSIIDLKLQHVPNNVNEIEWCQFLHCILATNHSDDENQNNSIHSTHRSTTRKKITLKEYNEGCQLYIQLRRNEIESRKNITYSINLPKVALNIQQIHTSDLYTSYYPKKKQENGRTDAKDSGIESKDAMKEDDLQIITLCTHCSMDRLYQIESLADSWNGRICLAVHVNIEQTNSKNHNQEERKEKEKDYQILIQSLLIKYPIRIIVTTTTINEEKNKTLPTWRRNQYPINALRNITMTSIQQDLDQNKYDYSAVLLMDIDFIVSRNLHLNLKKAFTWLLEKKQHNNVAIVVPAFEYTSPTKPPLDITPFLQYYNDPKNNSNITQFQHQQCPSSHQATNYHKWFTMSKEMTLPRITKDIPLSQTTIPLCDMYPILYPINYVTKYEPYLALLLTPTICTTDDVLPVEKKDTNEEWFDSRYTGYGYNKQSFVHSLFLKKYSFQVLIGSYVLSERHLPSIACQLYLKNPKERTAKRIMYEQMQ